MEPPGSYKRSGSAYDDDFSLDQDILDNLLSSEMSNDELHEALVASQVSHKKIAEIFSKAGRALPTMSDEHAGLVVYSRHPGTIDDRRAIEASIAAVFTTHFAQEFSKLPVKAQPDFISSSPIANASKQVMTRLLQIQVKIQEYRALNLDKEAIYTILKDEEKVSQNDFELAWKQAAGS